MRERADRRVAGARVGDVAPSGVHPPHAADRLDEGDARPAGLGVQLGVDVADPARRHAHPARGDRVDSVVDGVYVGVAADALQPVGRAGVRVLLRAGVAVGEGWVVRRQLEERERLAGGVVVGGLVPGIPGLQARGRVL